MEVKNSTISYEYITRTTRQIKKSAIADCFNVLLRVYVVVHRIRHLRR